jgi:lipid A 4'-phosphatase
MSSQQLPWLVRKPAILITLGATAAAAFVFLMWPEIDLAVAVAMHRLHADAALRAIGDAEPPDMAAIIKLFAGLFVLASLFVLLRRPLRVDRLRALLFILATFAIGPGLIANVLLKDHWGRARPVQIVEFGGSALFAPALMISDGCKSNCSFVSGDVSAALSFLAVALLVPARRRGWALAGTALMAGGIGFARMVVGAHFLSDVLFAGLFTLLVVQICYRLIMPRAIVGEAQVPAFRSIPAPAIDDARPGQGP